MRKLLFALIFLGTLHVPGQVKFLPHKNTEWHYQFNFPTGPAVNNEKIKYVNDSIVGNDTVKVVHHTRYFSTCENPSNRITLFKQKNDSVFFKSPKTFNQWQLLINYNALAGESWSFTIANNDNTPATYTVSVNSVSTTVVNGMSLKVLNVFYSSAQFANGYSKIYERFGDTKSLFNFGDKNSGTCDSFFADGILCYQDSTFGQKQFSSYPCDYETTGLNEVSLDKSLPLVFPNPTSGKLKLNFYREWEANEIKLLNVLGQEVYFTKNEDVIDITGLNMGVYFLQFYDNEKLIFTRKIIRE
ncbi:MAG: hypothetical protein JWO32_2543 [Bacteroidetes bacterium]|nr:hypothetical protein [Bacteroidota bacterium]